MQNIRAVPAKTKIRIPRNDGGAEDFEFEIDMGPTQLEFFFELEKVANRVTELIRYRVALITPYLKDEISWPRYIELCESNDKLIQFWSDHLKKLQA